MYEFSWTDGYGTVQSGTFVVNPEDMTISQLNFEYEMKNQALCDRGITAWCHFPGSQWEITESSFTSIDPASLYLDATNEEDVRIRFFPRNYAGSPDILLRYPTTSQTTKANSGAATWSVAPPQPTASPTPEPTLTPTKSPSKIPTSNPTEFGNTFLICDVKSLTVVQSYKIIFISIIIMS